MLKFNTRVTVPVTFSPSFASTQGSVQVLAQNELRASLTIQNLAPASATTAYLYYSFGTDAGPNQGVALGPGKGVILDVVCPTGALFVYMDDATARPLTIMEISWVN